jgi:glycosyltransferase involved in cell wall biosynthesis
MKLALFTHYAELFGANRSLLGLIDGLKPLGAECHVFMPYEGPLVKELNLRKVSFSIVSFGLWVRDPIEYRHPFVAMKRLKGSVGRFSANLINHRKIAKQVSEWGADIVHTNSAVIPIGAMVARAAGIPHVWHLREFCDLDYNVRFDLGKWLSVSFIHKSEALVVVSKAIEAHYIHSHAVREKTYLVYNGILTSDQFMIQKELSASTKVSDEFVFAIVGIIHPSKGHSLALEAIALLRYDFPRIRLIIAGSGDESYLRRLADKLGICDCIEFRGFVDDPFVVYREADAVLMCSRAEAMGRVTIEAMAACRPVIARATGGTVELVDDGCTGLLFYGDSRALAEVMGKLIKSPGLRFQLAENAWQHARDNYSLERYAEKVFNVYKILLGEI